MNYVIDWAEKVGSTLTGIAPQPRTEVFLQSYNFKKRVEDKDGELHVILMARRPEEIE